MKPFLPAVFKFYHYIDTMVNPLMHNALCIKGLTPLSQNQNNNFNSTAYYLANISTALAINLITRFVFITYTFELTTNTFS